MDITGSTIYTTTFPCSLCSKIIINSGIARIVCRTGYPDDLSRQLLREAQILIEIFAEDGKIEQLILEADAK